MKVYLVTTRANLEENSRIGEEIKALGHEFKLLDLLKFEYAIRNGKLFIEPTDDLPDVLILRGIFNNIKGISSHIVGLREKGVKVFDNNLLVHKYSINKISDLIKLADAGIPVPDSYHLHDFDKFTTSAKEIGYPVVVKLTRTGKGAGVYKFDNEEELGEFISRIKENGGEAKSYLLQQFIDYKYDLRVLIIGDKIYSMRRIPGEGEFRANFSLGGSVEKFDLDQEDEKLAKAALDAVDISVGGVDLLISKDSKRYILEVNHTAGMIGMEAATGENITKVFVEYAIKNAI